MRKIKYVLAGLVFIVSCRSETGSKTEQVTVTDSTYQAPGEITVLPYSVEFDEKTQALNLIKSRENVDAADANDVIRLLNKKYQGIKLDLVKSVADTIELKIDDAAKLTREMGSSGAETYLAELTFSLTELKGIHAVKLDFEEGDHAMPGVYTRSDFDSLVKK